MAKLTLHGYGEISVEEDYATVLDTIQDVESDFVFLNKIKAVVNFNKIEMETVGIEPIIININQIIFIEK